MSCNKLAALAALLALAVAACQPVPRPFQPSSKGTANLLLAPAADSSVLVAPVIGAPAPQRDQLAELVAAALRDRDVPASTRSASARSYLLQAERRGAVLVFRLTDPNGLSAGAFEQPVPAAFDRGDVAHLTGLAERTAERTAGFLRTDAGTTIAAPPRKVAIRGVDGAPGDGNQALARALAAILLRHSVALEAEPGDDTFIVVGAVRLSESGPGQQTVEIDWSLLRPDGRSVGAIHQKNAVPKGRLDGAWGDIAFAAAEGAAEGLLQVLAGLDAAPTRIPGN